MAIEVRGIRPDEADDVIRAVTTAFGERLTERDLEIERMVFETDRAMAAADADTFVGGTSVSSLTLTVPGAVVPAAGITGAAVLPTHRRRGILTAMMERLLEGLREREPVSILWAAEGEIYGRFGYGMATRGAEIKIQREHNAFRREHRPSGRIRLVEPDEAFAVIPAVYDRVAASQPGFPGQTEAWTRYRFQVHDFWDDGFGKHIFFGIHETGEGPDGYVTYRLRTDHEADRRTMRVEELLAASPEAYADLWRYALDVDLVSEVRGMLRRPDEPLLHLLADPNHPTVTLHDGLWVRLVRVAKALAARRYASEGRLVLEVADAFCPWNEGRVELVGGPDGAECAPTDADPDLRLTAEDLGAVYLGGISFRDLAWVGRIHGPPAALATADAMFAWDPPPWCPFVF